MTATDTLITAEEVLALDQSTDHSYALERCAHISDIEEQLFNECFGWAFYEALLADRINYQRSGSVPVPGAVTYEIYARQDSYTVGDKVKHEGIVYTVVQNTDGTQAISDTRYFTRAAKFANANYQYLWDRYLGRLLAFSVTTSSVMYRLLKDTARGLVKQFDEGNSRPASINEVMALKREGAVDVERIRANMDEYVRRNSAAFPGYKSHDDCREEDGCRTSLAGYTKDLGFNVEHDE
jgi:hypothetical protein